MVLAIHDDEQLHKEHGRQEGGCVERGGHLILRFADDLWGILTPLSEAEWVFSARGRDARGLRKPILPRTWCKNNIIVIAILLSLENTLQEVSS